MIKQKVEWTPLTEDSINELVDHNWYLLASEKFGTPLKAKYHADAPHFQIFATLKGMAIFDYCYVSDLGERGITHYMDMPLLPWELEEIVHGCQQTDEELPFVEVRDETNERI